MHPMTTHQLATENQRRILTQAAADRLARVATEGRPSFASRLIAALRPAPSRRPASRPEAPVARPEARPAPTGRA